jgi:two-component system cell cycle sensor histidine kinase/response regulator CckA
MNRKPDEAVNQNETPTEKALRASELSYRRLFESAKDGILILNADTGRIDDVNPFLFNLLGFSRSEMLGKTVGDLSPFKDIESNRIMLERLQRDGYVRYEDLPLETIDGRKIAVEFVSNVYQANVYQAGDRKVIQCNVRDITERKAAEKERFRLAAIIEYSDEAIVSKSASGIIIGWNHGAEKLYGYTAEEIIGRSVAILFPPDHYQEYLRLMKEIRSGKTVPSFDTVRIRKDGTLVDVSVGIIPIETVEGEVVGASKHSHDIGRIKKLEAQFIEAQKMEVIGRLAGGIAHDFNNILSIIIGYSDMLSSELNPESPAEGYVEEIRRAAERATALTRQLLVFSRKQTIEMVALDLNEVVSDMQNMLGRLVDENIELTIALGKLDGRIKADSGYVGQVVMNLVVNARDAMPFGGKLMISTHKVILDDQFALTHAFAIAGDYVQLSITDTGSGMSTEVKARLFEAFFTTKPKGQGTGLGLGTCQTIVKQSGGFIEVLSAVDRGTTFNVYFPLIDLPLEALVPTVKAKSHPVGTETLLLVEDEPSVRHLACSILRSQGYNVLSAKNGQEGLHVANEHKGETIRLVITDVIMPHMGGKVMADWLKALYPELKILYTTGYTNDAISQQGLDGSSVALLSKPYTPAALTRKVREMLDEK